MVDLAPIPAHWQFSPATMTAMIAVHHPGAMVSSVKLVDGSDGTSSRARLGLEYASGSGPSTVFAKTKGDWKHRLLHLATGNAFIEARLFGSGVTLPVEHPAIYHTVIDRPRLNDLVVMEDLSARGATLHDGTRALNADEAASGLRGLARLHTAFWRDTRPSLQWVRPCSASRSFRWLMKLGCVRGTPRLVAHLPKEVVKHGSDRLVELWERYVKLSAAEPMTLLHGDAHVGNTYLTAAGELGFLDWAVVRRVHWSFDVGYFLISALNTEDRRRHERELLEEYRGALQVPAQERPSSAEAWLRYRASAAYGLPIWISTGAEDTYQSPAVCRSLAQRFGDAFVDLDTPAAVRELEA